MPEPIIQVSELGYRYRKSSRDRRALDGLSFSVHAGEIVGLLGPNGAGKTTAVRILSTILRPGSGRALVGGHDVSTQPLRARRQIAAVLQESAVETLLSTWDNLMIYGYLHGMSRPRAVQEAGRVSEVMGLEGHLTTRAQELSGGYKRRLQIAKALMVDTPLLFLDEATTGMDTFAKRRTVEAIRTQAASGRTVLLTTHLLDEAESLCDRMILMNRGRAMAGGRLSELRSLSRKMFRIKAGFAGASGEAVAALRALGPKELRERGGEAEMVVEGSEDEWIRKMAEISSRWPLSHLEIHGVNLEQIFVQMYGEEQEENR